MALLGRGKAPAAVPFQPITDLIATTPQEPEWLWDGFLAPGSILVVAGQPKVGKSTLIYGLLAALQQGTTFLGRATRATGALVLTEERRDGITEKARRFQLGERIVTVPRGDTRGVEWPELVTQAADEAERRGLGLLVVDTLADLAGLDAEEENDAGSVLAALRPLQQAADRGLAVLVVAHHRKSGGKHGSAVRGSNALIGAADVIADLTRGRGGSVRLLDSESRFSSTPSRVVAALEGDSYVVREKAETRDEERIIEALTALGSANEKVLSEATEIPATTLRRRIANMLDGDRPRLSQTGTGGKSDPVIYVLAVAP